MEASTACDSMSQDLHLGMHHAVTLYTSRVEIVDQW